MNQPPFIDPARRVGIAGCKHTTLDLIRSLARHGIRIQHCLTLDPQLAAREQVAGYLDLRPELEALGIPYTLVKTYSLKSEEDQRTVRALGLDLLLAMGWQRLIPAWLLDHLPCGAYGMHGSFRPLPHGRGRSPMNWSIIVGQDRFYTHLIQYLPGVDDGPVVGCVRFDINPYDTALTLHHKNMVAMARIVAENLPGLLDGSVRPAPQPSEGASYWPKRSTEDGLIDWEDPAEAICRLVRAATRPFPGAFSFLDDDPAKKLTIWRAQPFDTYLNYPGAACGEIVEFFYDGSFVVRCGDATALVTESEGPALTPEAVGRRLGAAGIARKIWGDLPQ